MNDEDKEEDVFIQIIESITYFCLCFCCCGRKDDEEIEFKFCFIKIIFMILVLILWVPILTAIGYLIYGFGIAVSPSLIIYYYF